MGKKKVTQTEWLMEAVVKAEEKTEEECSCKSFPPMFLLGLRGALEAGLSCEQIVAFLILFTGVYETADSMVGSELVERAEHIGRIMRGDIDYLCVEQLRLTRNREERSAKKHLAKMRRKFK